MAINHKPEELKSFDCYHIVGISELWCSGKSFHLLSAGSEIMVVVSFFKNEFEFLKKEKYCNSERIEDFKTPKDGVTVK